MTYTLRVRLAYRVEGRRWTMTLTRIVDGPLPRVADGIATPFGVMLIDFMTWQGDVGRVTTCIKPLGCITDAEVQRISREWLAADGHSVAQDEERRCECIHA